MSHRPTGLCYAGRIYRCADRTVRSIRGERDVATNVGIEQRSPAGRGGAATSRTWPSAICGCTSRGWAPTRPRGARDRPWRGLLRLRRARQALPGRPLGPLLRERRPRPGGAGRGRRASGAELGFYANWSYAHPPAIELAARIASSRRVTSTACSSPRAAPRRSSRPGSWRATATASGVTGSAPRSSPASSPTTAPRWALAATGLTGAAHAVRAADTGRLPRPEHEQLPLAGWTATRCGPPTRSRSGSCSRARRRSPR